MRGEDIERKEGGTIEREVVRGRKEKEKKKEK